MSSLPDPKQLLVVEDDSALREWLRLELRPHLLTMAAHQEAAYAELEARRFDLVLLDLRLPVSARDIEPHSDVGFDILRSIRQQYTRDRLPVVVMTAYEGTTSETTVRAFKWGANDYWSKDGRHSRTLPEVVEGNLRQQAERRERFAKELSERRHRLHFHLARCCAVLDDFVTFQGKPYGVLAALRRNHGEGVKSGKEPPFMRLSTLTKTLDTGQDPVRKLVERIRKDIAASYLEAHGVAPDKNAVIESVQGKGYRLNPTKVEVAVVR